MKQKLIAGFEETTEDLLQTLSGFTQEEFNKIPFEGSWSAGQVAEHLYKSESNIPKVLNGNSKETERDPFEKTALIETVFLDYTKKLQSPGFILPSEAPKNKDYFLKAFETTRKELRNAITNLDLARTLTDFPFPQMGEFTGWEWICFAVSHSKRHIRQMKIIGEKLKGVQKTAGDAA
jgi:uncharacterized damage-inducible protein DinB